MSTYQPKSLKYKSSYALSFMRTSSQAFSKRFSKESIQSKSTQKNFFIDFAKGDKKSKLISSLKQHRINQSPNNFKRKNSFSKGLLSIHKSLDKKKFSTNLHSQRDPCQAKNSKRFLMNVSKTSYSFMNQNSERIYRWKTQVTQNKENRTFCAQMQKLKTQFLESFDKKQQQYRFSPNKMLFSLQQNKILSSKNQQTHHLNSTQKYSFKDLCIQISQKIDPIGAILNGTSQLTSKFKIPFRTTMFLMYKLLWYRRLKYLQKLNLAKRTQEDQKISRQFQTQNQQIRDCLCQMLEKLKQAKTWDQQQKKDVIQNLTYDQNVQKQVAILMVKKSLHQLNKFKSIQLDHQSETKIIFFGCSVVVQTINFLQFKHRQNLNQVNTLKNPPKLNLEQMAQILSQLFFMLRDSEEVLK